MEERPKSIKELLLNTKIVEEALWRGVQHALLEHKRAGNPIAVWQDGRVVIIPPEEIPVEDPLAMSKYDKLLLQILRGTSDANISFDDLCQLLRHLGFEERTRGSYHIFRRQGVEEKINLQRDDGKAKAYQVRQARAVILKYRLGDEA
jgi:hypothetical protein